MDYFSILFLLKAYSESRTNRSIRFGNSHLKMWVGEADNTVTFRDTSGQWELSFSSLPELESKLSDLDKYGVAAAAYHKAFERAVIAGGATFICSNRHKATYTYNGCQFHIHYCYRSPLYFLMSTEAGKLVRSVADSLTAPTFPVHLKEKLSPAEIQPVIEDVTY